MSAANAKNIFFIFVFVFQLLDTLSH